jgi:3-hydroxyacyl-CoA dehydrogenase
VKNLCVAGSGTMGEGIEAVVIAGIHAANEILPIFSVKAN